LSTPLILRAPRRGVPFKLYIATEEKTIGAILTQEGEGKEYSLLIWVVVFLIPRQGMPI
jgi:hypothetical protein